MNKVLVDAGPLIALFDKSDQHHATVLNWLKQYEGKLLTTWPVITEAVYMLDFNPQVPVDFIKWIHSGGVEIIEIPSSDIADIITIFEKYRDLPSDMADVSLLFISEKNGIRQILTIDSDFNAYRTPDGQFLQNVLR